MMNISCILLLTHQHIIFNFGKTNYKYQFKVHLINLTTLVLNYVFKATILEILMYIQNN